MSDTIHTIKGAQPRYPIWENGAAYGRNGVTYFQYAEFPESRQPGQVSRFQTPSAINMPANRQLFGIEACDRLEAAIAGLSDDEAQRLASWARTLESVLDGEYERNASPGDRYSLTRTGDRIWTVHQMQKHVRQMRKGSRHA
jgi:hypothetical protein